MRDTVAIVGGGLTGLALAWHLNRAGVPFHLYEARSRLGGRIQTAMRDGAGFDLGPSWFWPGQSRMAQLVNALGLERLDQWAEGALLYETEQGEVIRDRGFSSMQGSYRVRGGMGGLVSGIAAQLPKSAITLSAPVRAVSAAGGLTFEDGQTVDEAARTVLALPPRLAAEVVRGSEFSPVQIAALQGVPTWMAGHAKLVAVYDTPFWREDGLSGDAMSRRGPMVEIHDAGSGASGALFGFLAVPPAVRTGQRAAVIEACVAQLGRVFGPPASAPLAVFYTDWAEEEFTSVAMDRQPLTHHPAYGRPETLRAAPGDRVCFAGTELAPEMGGYLEGALASAEEAADWVLAN